MGRGVVVGGGILIGRRLDRDLQIELTRAGRVGFAAERGVELDVQIGVVVVVDLELQIELEILVGGARHGVGVGLTLVGVAGGRSTAAKHRVEARVARPVHRREVSFDPGPRHANLDESGHHRRGQHPPGEVGVDGLFEAPEDLLLLLGRSITEDGSPQTQWAVLDDGREQELASATKQQLEALVLDDVVRLVELHGLTGVGQRLGAGSHPPELVEGGDGVATAAIAQHLLEEVLDLGPGAVKRHARQHDTSRFGDPNELADGGAPVGHDLTEHEVGDGEIVALIVHLGDVVEVALLEVDALLPLRPNLRLGQADLRGLGLDGEHPRARLEAVKQLAGGPPGVRVHVEDEATLAGGRRKVRETADDHPREAIVPDGRDLAVEDPGVALFFDVGCRVGAVHEVCSGAWWRGRTAAPSLTAGRRRRSSCRSSAGWWTRRRVGCRCSTAASSWRPRDGCSMWCPLRRRSSPRRGSRSMRTSRG